MNESSRIAPKMTTHNLNTLALNTRSSNMEQHGDVSWKLEGNLTQFWRCDTFYKISGDETLKYFNLINTMR